MLRAQRGRRPGQVCEFDPKEFGGHGRVAVREHGPDHDHDGVIPREGDRFGIDPERAAAVAKPGMLLEAAGTEAEAVTQVWKVSAGGARHDLFLLKQAGCFRFDETAGLKRGEEPFQIFNRAEGAATQAREASVCALWSCACAATGDRSGKAVQKAVRVRRDDILLFLLGRSGGVPGCVDNVTVLIY